MQWHAHIFHVQCLRKYFWEEVPRKRRSWRPHFRDIIQELLISECSLGSWNFYVRKVFGKNQLAQISQGFVTIGRILWAMYCQTATEEDLWRGDFLYLVRKCLGIASQKKQNFARKTVESKSCSRWRVQYVRNLS